MDMGLKQFRLDKVFNSAKLLFIALIAVVWGFSGSVWGSLQPQALEFAGIYDVQRLDPNLDGAGVRITSVCRSYTYVNGYPGGDFAPDLNHPCLAGADIELIGPKLKIENNLEFFGKSAHSLAILSILAGNDSGAENTGLGSFEYRGILSGADIEVCEFWHFVTKKIFNIGEDIPDANCPQVLTMSIGSYLPDWWTRGIEHLAESRGTVVVAGVGNGSGASEPVLYPGGGSNVIGVGVIDSVYEPDLNLRLANFALPISEHTSLGPTSDGRTKPDIVAPGNCLVANDDINEPYSVSGNWCSFSTPIVAGAAGLLLQAAGDDPCLSIAADPNYAPMVIKAILLNSAKKLPYWHKGLAGSDDDHIVPLDYSQGAGALDAYSAMDTLLAGRYSPTEEYEIGWEVGIFDANDDEIVYRVRTAELVDEYMAVTLAWNRHYQDEYPFGRISELDTDLRLTVRGIDGQGRVREIDYSDSAVDCLEHVYCKLDPNCMNYEIVVSAGESGIRPGLSERFGISWEVRRPEKHDPVSWFDLNFNGVVDANDVMELVDRLGKAAHRPGGYLLGDVNNNGIIEKSDIPGFIKYFGQKAKWRGQ